MILDALEEPHTIPMLMEMKLYRHRQSLERRLGVLQHDGVVWMEGFVSNGKGTGKPRAVYSVRRWKDLEHNVRLTQIGRRWRIRLDRQENTYRSDAVVLGAHVELDMGTKSLAAVEDQLRRYEGTGETVIFITTSDRRVRNVLERCAFLGDDLVACTLDCAEKSPSEVVLTYTDGETVLLQNLLQNLRELHQAKTQKRESDQDDALFE